MTNKEKIKLINSWQNHPSIYPILCDFNPKHKPLKPKENIEGKIELYCPNCSFRKCPPITIYLSKNTENFENITNCSVKNCNRPLTKNTSKIIIIKNKVTLICCECAKKVEEGHDLSYSMGCKIT